MKTSPITAPTTSSELTDSSENWTPDVASSWLTMLSRLPKATAEPISPSSRLATKAPVPKRTVSGRGGASGERCCPGADGAAP